TGLPQAPAIRARCRYDAPRGGGGLHARVHHARGHGRLRREADGAPARADDEGGGGRTVSAAPRERTVRTIPYAAQDKPVPKLPGGPPKLVPGLAFLQRVRASLEEGANPASALTGAIGS